MEVNSYLKNLTCLYVEDDNFTREVFSIMIKRYFKNVLTAENGKIGLELYKSHMPDIIITDIRMPIMDGIEMAREIKKINPNAYIIFITAFTDIEYLKEAINLNVEGYITKPIDKKFLIHKLNFLAKIIKNEREKKELFNILQILFDMQSEASALYEDGKIKLANEKFKKIFNEKILLSELVEKFKIDINKEKQTIYVKNGYVSVYEVKIVKIASKYIMISFYDITDYEKEIFIDQLTNIYNRKYLNKIIEKYINKKMCIILTDIDFFKKVNDTYGHPKGDEILNSFAEILKKYLRKDDVIIRMGGEEFLIILKNNSTEELKTIAEKLRKIVEEENFNGIKITASFGVCCGKINDMKDFDKLYKKVDLALYEAKENGRNQVRICKE